MVDGADQVVLTTCPRDCYDACGIAVVKRNGSIRHVRGDPDHSGSRGKLCRKCSIGYNGAFLDPQARLTRPLRRIGEKGEARFEPVSWDEALAAIAGRLERIAAAPGPHTILNTHYTGTFSLLAYLFPLASSIGSARPRSTPTRSATRQGTSRSSTCTAARSSDSTP